MATTTMISIKVNRVHCGNHEAEGGASDRLSCSIVLMSRPALFTHRIPPVGRETQF